MKKNIIKKPFTLTILITLLMSLMPGAVAYAAPPPYGMIIDNMWAFESEQFQVAYSMTPVPSFRDDNSAGPKLVLTPGTEFNFYFGNNVQIFPITEWDTSEMAEHTLASQTIYEGREQGSYIFNNPGLFVIFFHGYTMIEVQVGNATSSVAQANEIKVTLNGKALSFDVPPQIIDGRTLVPLRVIFEALGATVDWNGNTQTVTAVKGNTNISLRIGGNMLTKNGVNIALDVPAQIINGRTLVPARAVAESFGAKVDWDSGSRTVIIIN